MGSERDGYPVAWVLWFVGFVMMGAAAGSVVGDHPGAAKAIGVALLLMTAAHAINLYWERLAPPE